MPRTPMTIIPMEYIFKESESLCSFFSDPENKTRPWVALLMLGARDMQMENLSVTSCSSFCGREDPLSLRRAFSGIVSVQSVYHVIPLS